MTYIKIMSWNCNGISTKVHEPSTFIKLHSINIVLLGETRLSPNTTFNIPGFHVYLSDHPPKPKTPPNWGTAVLVRRGIVHQHVAIATILDSTSVNIQLGSVAAQVTAVYKSPGATLKPRDLNAPTIHNGLFIIAGDLNAKHYNWHSALCNTAGRTLMRHQESQASYSVVASESPTHYPYISAHRPDVPDILIFINYPIDGFRHHQSQWFIFGSQSSNIKSQL